MEVGVVTGSTCLGLKAGAMVSGGVEIFWVCLYDTGVSMTLSSSGLRFESISCSRKGTLEGTTEPI